MSENTVCPLPPPMPPLNSDITVKNTAEVFSIARVINNFKITDSDSIWASKYPELRRACILNDICVKCAPLYFSYTHFESRLQEGPTCGLVAMSILLAFQISPPELLKIAKDKNYSNNGELFSVKSAHALLEIAVASLNSIGNKSEILEKDLFSTHVITLLLSGCTALVPYDSDRNHSPCLRKGHKAHWALITGIIVVNKQTHEMYNADDVYVTAKQGKSLHLGLWKLKDLAASNQNLVEFAPEKRYDKLEYIVPSCGLGGVEGLKGQFILIHPNTGKIVQNK